MYLNKAFLYGNLTRDPELKSLPSGTQVANFAIATNRVYKDKNGVKQEAVEYHNIVSFGKQAEVIAQYLKKGRAVFVEGRIQTRSWDDQASGQKRYRTEVVLENFQFGPSAQGGGARNKTEQERGTDTEGGGSESGGIQYPEENIKAEDIPF